MEQQKYRIHLDNFDGPLDLLLHLIDKNQMDIYDIQIAEITAQYLDFLAEAQEMDLEIASEFLILAATLIQIKIKMLLPQNKAMPEEADPREDLVNRLLEYKFYKEVSTLLKENAEKAGVQVQKEIDIEEIIKSFPPENPLKNVSPEQLWQSFARVMQHLREEPSIIVLPKETYDVATMRNVLVDLLQKEQAIKFDTLFSAQDAKAKVIAAFLALLELFKSGHIRLQQEENCGVLWLYWQ